MNALVKTDNKPVVEQKQYLTFTLGGEMFSISILCIKEIIWYANLTEVPMMPACIRGVINLRGAVVPVMDLSARFGKPPTAVTKSTCIIIIEVQTQNEGESQSMGVVVDAVQAVLEIPSSEIEPPPTFGAKIRSDFIEGIGKVNGKFVILLNVNRVLSNEEIGAMGRVAASTDLAVTSS
ncbi:MAG: chemotaxis protein CheW [Rhodoferax sp.]|uniref:chemotaxis protein CheW n=1 Tax=Rhodoferax sp. TaxID=50421 RepID=UPI0030172F30